MAKGWLLACHGGVVDEDAAAGHAKTAGANHVRRNRDEKLVGIDFCALFGALEAGELAETGNAFDVAGFIARNRAGDESRLAGRDGDDRGEAAVVENGNAVDGAAAEGFNLHVERDGDVAGALNFGRSFDGDAEVLVLDLRDSDCGGSAELRQ